jgi:DAK2 domain fusion protein YloV
MISEVIRTCFPIAAKAVADKAEEINKLNVFPVPDGDTGTNMSLTLNTVVNEMSELPAGASMEDVAKAITHGSLMGARGNSGVIMSQILRGVAEGLVDAKGEDATSADVASALQHAEKVAFQAVRKPVEGTILTVLHDVRVKAEKCAKSKMSVEETLSELVVEAYESVARTPDLLPVLKENGVVDSGAYGFSVFLEAFVRAALGDDAAPEVTPEVNPEVATGIAKDAVSNKVQIELNDDWEGSDYRYCTEFLFYSEVGPLDEDAELAFLASMGDCELLVGDDPYYKIHVHSNEPNVVLGHMLERGQIFEVFIHNMDLEAKDRTAKIAADQQEAAAAEQAEPERPKKDLGFVAVASGSGEASILKSLGVDVVVSGGQTMNPSTADIIAAVQKANASHVIVLPDNGNIRMAAEAAAGACDGCEVVVVPTKTVPQAFSAMFAINPEASLEENAEAMKEAIAGVRDGEVTTAVRDSAAADGTPIHAGDVMGIYDGAIVSVGSSVKDVTVDVVNRMQDDEEGDTLTLLRGDDMSEDDFDDLCEAVQAAQPDLELDPQFGGQPLYPVIFSIE